MPVVERPARDGFPVSGPTDSRAMHTRPPERMALSRDLRANPPHAGHPQRAWILDRVRRLDTLAREADTLDETETTIARLLVRRARYLVRRIRDCERDLSFDREEVNALIKVLTVYVDAEEVPESSDGEITEAPTEDPEAGMQADAEIAREFKVIGDTLDRLDAAHRE